MRAHAAPMSGPRVRFAPSPTGYLHVGSARTALFNWLFARGQGGTFVLRIEDTDTERNREEWAEGILTALSWLGMEPDEGPFRQSERGERYQVAIEALWDSGFLYACDCTRDDVEARAKEGAPPGYDGYCRDRGLERGPGRALRFRTPDTGETTVVDLVRGDVTFPHAAMEDFVCVKSNGGPLFVLANVVDDRDMAITHVIRGEDLLPTSPKGVLLWQALDTSAEGEAGWGQATPLPVFAHLPMLVDEQRKKLSKRWDSVAVESYRSQGFLPEAFRNYLALLGWSPAGDEEKVPLEVLVDTFRLEDVNQSPAFFDVQKLTHMNGEYIRELPVAEFVEACRPWVAPSTTPDGWAPGGPPPWPEKRFDPETFLALAPLVQERVSTLSEAPGMVDFIFLADPLVDDADWQKVVAGDDGALGILDAAVAAYAGCEWKAPVLHEVTLSVAESVGRKLGKAQAPIRVAITGRRVGPPLFEALEVLGRDEVLRRLRVAIDRAGGAGSS
jgi:glutamyl-tRNA synthetase